MNALANRPEHYDEPTAFAEGWLLSERDDGVYEIQKRDNGGDRYDLRCGLLDPFKTDAEAIDHVAHWAAAGSKMHAEALALNGKRWTS
jgi:hypothetical protein